MSACHLRCTQPASLHFATAAVLFLACAQCLDLNLQRAQVALHPEKQADDFVINVVRDKSAGNQFLSQIKYLPGSPSSNNEALHPATDQLHVNVVDDSRDGKKYQINLNPAYSSGPPLSPSGPPPAYSSGPPPAYPGGPPSAPKQAQSSTPDSNAMEAELYEFVKNWVAEHFNKQSVDINVDTHFEKDLGADSLERMDILLEFEKHPKGARIPDEKAANIETVGHLFEELKAAKMKLNENAKPQVEQK